MVLENISFVNNLNNKCCVVGVYSNKELSKSAKALNEKLDGEIDRISEKVSFPQKIFETYTFVSSSDEYANIIVICLGEYEKTFTSLELEKLGASIYSAVNKFNSCLVSVSSDDVRSKNQPIQSLIAFGSLLKSWSFDRYKAKKNEKIILKDLQFFTTDVQAAENAFKPLKNLAESIFLTRSVVSEPANVIYPESLAEIARNQLQQLGVAVEILNKNDMAALNMNALLGVAQGSANEPKLVILSWNGAKESGNPMAFVGKGVTFDSGGISIKPSDGMEDMRHDMAGSGAVLGLMKAVALNKLPVNVVGVMALAENMPSGTAQRPGDIVKSMSGQTIEVINTDAEGRLILADALWYTQERFKPKAMVDLATLTGAIVVALGHEFAGLFSNDDKLVERINKSAEKTGEKVWRLPMTDNFDDGINSDNADVMNVGKPNIRGSSITAAHFLKRFVNNVPWAHIDIAGVESTSNDLFIAEKGATGFGVHLLYDLLADMDNIEL
jgi:leucyl aminopeptidase